MANYYCSGNSRVNEMELFEVDRDEFEDLPEFNLYLSNDDESPIEDDLHIASGISQYTEEEFLNLLRADGFELEDYGAITRIEKEYTQNGEEYTAGFYLYYHPGYDGEDDEGGVVLLYTNQRKTKEIDHTVMELFEDAVGLYYLHVGPRLFQIIREEVLQEEEYAEIVEFVADRRKDSDKPARIRPEFKRTISYFGEDGWQTLREMEENYGVRPRYLKFNIPNDASFKIARDGVFSLSSGNLDTLFKYVQVCIQEGLEIKQAFDGSDFEMVASTDKLSIPTAEPAVIDLNRELQFEQLDAIKSRMDDEDYFIVDSFGQEGSLHFTSKVYDKKKDNTFRLKATDRTIRVFPQEEDGDLGAFLRFHEFIQNHIDPDAEATTP